MWLFIVFFPQLKSTQRCITPASSLSPTLHRCVSWSWLIFRYVTSCGFNRSVTMMDLVSSFFSILLLQKSAIYSLKDVQILPYRYLETHQWCKGSGGPCSAPFQVHLREKPWGLEPAQFALRSNRSEPGGRRHACWWWCSLCLHCVIFPSASSISWKGKS